MPRHVGIEASFWSVTSPWRSSWHRSNLLVWSWTGDRWAINVQPSCVLLNSVAESLPWMQRMPRKGRDGSSSWPCLKVGSSSRRPLDSEKYGGFALVVRSLGTRQVSFAFYSEWQRILPKVDIDINIDANIDRWCYLVEKLYNYIIYLKLGCCIFECLILSVARGFLGRSLMTLRERVISCFILAIR